jgi:dienelactone hydrolase
MKHLIMWIVIASMTVSVAHAQVDAKHIEEIVAPPLQSPQVVTHELHEYLLQRAPQLPTPKSAQEWTQESDQIRQRLLNDVVFHGWPKDWITSPPKFQDMGEIPAGKGYRLRKLRYEIVPGFYSTALLYEPAKIQGRIPAVLNVMGHWGERGKSMDFEQKLCINQALHGMIALNLEWLGGGDLTSKENAHWLGPELDLVGANGVGLFYLAMRRGLDYLAENPDVDPNRIGMTGLSGGGWQTIVLSSLDPRVKVSIPVAGYGTITERIARQTFAIGEPGDPEQEPTDFLTGVDYSTLTAMRAPRPTLLINNAEDTCCYRAPLVKPYIFDAVRPFFKLYGNEDAFQFYQNTDISAHNYGRSNREQAYQFFTKNFNLPIASSEIPVGEDIKSYDQLAVEIPGDNLTILGLAKKMASEIQRSPIPSDAPSRKKWQTEERTQLRNVVRYKPVTVATPLLENDTHHSGLESISYRFEFSNGLSATGIRIREVETPDTAPIVIVLDDRGSQAAATEVWGRAPMIADLLSEGNQVFVLNLVFTGDAAPNIPSWSLTGMLRAIGERPLGIEAAQLIATAHWAQKAWGSQEVLVESSGMRSQVEALTAAALEPSLFRQVVTHSGMHSLRYLLDKPVDYRAAPDLFCLDLYKYFDLDRLAAIAAPTSIVQKDYLELQGKL